MGLRKLVSRIFAAMVMFCAIGLFACGTEQAANKAAEDAATGQVSEMDIQNSDASVHTMSDTVIIIGMVRIYGSEPHTFAGIESEDGGIYAVYPREKEVEIRSLQGRLIEFTVRFLENPAGEGSLYLRDGTVTPLSWHILTP